MKIYNEAKTEEIFNPDLEHGYLYEDRRLVRHHDAIPEKIMKTVEEIKAELEAEGKKVLQESDGKWYIMLNYYPATKTRFEGMDLQEIEPVKEPAVEAWDEYEDIQVYHAYTNEEYTDYIRGQREVICFSVINRGAAWYARLTEGQKAELQTWYQAWLDAPQTGVMPSTPEWI